MSKEIYGWCTECNQPVNMCDCDVDGHNVGEMEDRVLEELNSDPEVQELIKKITEYFDNIGRDDVQQDLIDLGYDEGFKHFGCNIFVGRNN